MTNTINSSWIAKLNAEYEAKHGKSVVYKAEPVSKTRSLENDYEDCRNEFSSDEEAFNYVCSR